MDLADKIVVITGASGGIGEEVVKKLNSEKVVGALVAKSINKLKNLVNNLNKDRLKIFGCDFSKRAQTLETVKRISKEFEKIDILINCAGIGVYKPIEEVKFKEWDDSFSINVDSVFVFTKELLSSLENSESPLVLNVGSGAGIIPMAGRSVYCATKFALRGLTLSLAEEFKKSKIKFCLLTLGSTLTSFGPMSFKEKNKDMLSGKPYFTPDWVAKKIVKIIKDDKREIEYTLYPSDYGLGKWEKPNLFK